MVAERWFQERQQLMDQEERASQQLHLFPKERYQQLQQVEELMLIRLYPQV